MRAWNVLGFEPSTLSLCLLQQRARFHCHPPIRLVLQGDETSIQISSQATLLLTTIQLLNRFQVKMSASSVRQVPNDDAFYENLTLGLIRVLGNIPRITSINYDKRNPAERNSVNAWESRHNVNLPVDMKSFYLCTDGFCLFWSYEYSANDIKRVGKIHIPHLIQITLVRENLESIMPGNQVQTKTSTTSAASDAIPQLNLSTKSKIFELSTILDVAKVVMLYETPESCPRIYLLELETLKLQFLADTFSEYLRMAIAHLGLPFWELCFSSCCPLPSWTQVWLDL